MAVFVPQKKVDDNTGFGRLINEFSREYVSPELTKRNVASFYCALIELVDADTRHILLDEEVHVILEFKNRKLDPGDTGKRIPINLKEIKNVSWPLKGIRRNSAKILMIHFNNDWWILKTDFRKHPELEARYKLTTTHKVRGGGYLPLSMLRKQKSEYLSKWQKGLQVELPGMWKRYVAVSQKYRGAMVYDGNYFDLFMHANDLFVLGYYYTVIILCRTAAEQALVTLLMNRGKAFDIYKTNGKIKSLQDLVGTCRSHSVFGRRLPINKSSAKKLNEVARLAGDIVHPKQDLGELDQYKDDAIKCMDYLYYVIKSHLNFIKDTGTVSGYKIKGTVKRLK